MSNQSPQPTPLFALNHVRFLNVLSIDALQFESGKISCIVGSSGSGKSTLLKLLNRMISPSAGTITWKGDDIATMDPVQLRRRIVMLPQNPIMFDGTVRENVLKGLEFSDRPIVSDDEINDLLKTLKVRTSIGSSAAYISGGERQRVALARVLVMRPDVLLLDEPTSALDDGTEEVVMQAVVNETRKRGGEIILVTHSRSVAKRWGEEIIEIEDGKLANTRMEAHHE